MTSQNTTGNEAEDLPPTFVDSRQLVEDQALYHPASRSLASPLDPFRTISIDIDRTVSWLLQYYLYQYHPPIWRYEASSLPHEPSAFRKSINGIVNVAFEDALTMHCLLNTAAARVRCIDGVQTAGSIQRELASTGKALSLLRVQVRRSRSQDSMERLVGCIILLAQDEAYKGDLVAAKIHCKAAVKLLEPLGGLFALQDQYLQGRILDLDLVIASVMLEPCQLACEFDPGPLKIVDSLANRPGALRHASSATSLLSREDAILPAALRDLIRQIVECYDLRTRVENESFSPSPGIARWVTLRIAAIRNRLLAYTVLKNTTNALRVALIISTFLPTATDDVREDRVVKLIAPKLKSALDQTTFQDWKLQEDIRLWILLMGYFCTNVGNTTYGWFLEQIHDAVAFGSTASLGIRFDAKWLLEDLVAFQYKFLFQQQTQLTATEQLAQILFGQKDSTPREDS